MIRLQRLKTKQRQFKAAFSLYQDFKTRKPLINNFNIFLKKDVK
jgi:hypothetical protein